MRFTVLLLLLITTQCFSQNYTISGFLDDEESGEELIGATIYEAKSLKGTVTNYYGFYSLTLPEGKHEIKYRYVGYPEKTVIIDLFKDTTLSVHLSPSIEIDEVVVEAKSNNIVESTQMSVTDIPIRQLEQVPVLLGESDVLKIIQLLPGVQSGGEGTSGLYVRGGGPDQNLFLIDGVPVYNANHLFGFLSIFNSDAIKNVTLYKGGFPARFGGRLSSVIDVRTKEGNNKFLKGTASIGLISSKLTLEGPLFGEKTTFIVSGRRTYIDVLARPALKTLSAYGETMGYYFYDLNGKLTHSFSEKDKLFASIYRGKDVLYFGTDQKYYRNAARITHTNTEHFGWGNLVGSLRWNHVFGSKLFANTTATFTDYIFYSDYEIYEDYEDWDSVSYYNLRTGYYSGIRDYSLNIDFDYHPHSSHDVKFGTKAVIHDFTPGEDIYEKKGTANIGVRDSINPRERIKVNELNTYIEDDITLGKKLKLNIGVHNSIFMLNNHTYYSIEPRISARYLVSKKISLKASYAEMNQYIHLLTSSKIESPTDLWMPATKDIKPQNSKQTAFGLAYAINKELDFSTEVFYKQMDNLLEYREGAAYMLYTESWESLVERGSGTSYGMEFFLQKVIGKTSGWIGYTLSKSDRVFPGINNGKIYPYRYDRRHDISVVFNYKINNRIDVGATWVFGTGNAVSLAYEKQLSLNAVLDDLEYGRIDNLEVLDVYEGKNNFRMPAYHRLDLGINFHKEVKWGDRTWSFGIYNAYNRLNPYMIRHQDVYNQYTWEYEGKKLMKVSIFPLIPSIKYSLQFEAKKMKWSHIKETLINDF